MSKQDGKHFSHWHPSVTGAALTATRWWGAKPDAGRSGQRSLHLELIGLRELHEPVGVLSVDGRGYSSVQIESQKSARN